MASTTWRINAIDTEGQPLVLSTLELWGATSRVDAGAVLTSSHAPISGSLANLTDGDPLTTCTWSAKDAAAPGFYIQWVLPVAQDAWCARFAAPTAQGFPWNYSLGYPTTGTWLWARQGRVRYLGANTLSSSRQGAPAFGIETSWSGATTPAMTNGPGACAVSADGKDIFIGSRGSSTAAWISGDFGNTWSPVSGLSTAGTGFSSAEMKGSVILAATLGASGAVRLSRDSGTTWTTITGITPGTQGFNSVAMSDDATVMLVLTRAPVSTLVVAWISTDGGLTWASASPPGSHRGLGYGSVSGDGQVLAVGGYSATAVAISRDGGASWSTTSTGTTGGYGGCAVSQSGTTIVVIPYTNAGSVLKSEDTGATWAQVFSSARRLGALSISADGSTIVAADADTSILQVHLTADGGNTWTTTSLNTFSANATIAGSAVSGDGRFAAVLGTSTGASLTENLARWVKRDASYAEDPLRTFEKTPALVMQGGNPLPQELGPVTSVGAALVRDMEFGGNGRIYGTVERKNTPANVPMRRRVRLHRSRDGLLVRETWSKADGTYEFNGISMQYEYDTIAWDNEMSYRSVVANNLKPEAM